MIHAPKDHLLLSCDLSQAEAWVVAYAADEPRMKAALKTGKIHETTAQFCLELPSMVMSEEQRYVGKKCNHAFNYRMGPERCCEIINKEGLITVSNKQTKKFHSKYLELYRIQDWWREIEEKLKYERSLQNYYGFRRNFHQAISPELFKEGTAFIPQSTIADHMYGNIQPNFPRSGGLLEVHRQITSPSKGEFKLVHSAHDSCIIEFPKRHDVKELYCRVKNLLERPMMINGEEFTVPMDGKYGEVWEDGMEKIKNAA